MNSGSSNTDLNNLGEIGEQLNDEYEYDDFNGNNGSDMDNGINKTEDVGRFLENKLNKKNSCSSYNSYFDEKENIYNIHNDNKINKEIENDINSVKNKENDIPINEIILDNEKRNITIYQRKNNTQKMCPGSSDLTGNFEKYFLKIVKAECLSLAK